MSDPNDLPNRVALVQVPLMEAGRPYLVEQEIEWLRTLIRLAVEFEDRLQRTKIEAMERDEVQYLAGSVFSGLNCFLELGSSYHLLDGAGDTQVGWPVGSTIGSPLELRQQYLTMYQEFLSETTFVNRCRLVLDLFKLQLIFVAIAYDW
jgi:hypothetical protein